MEAKLVSIAGNVPDANITDTSTMLPCEFCEGLVPKIAYPLYLVANQTDRLTDIVTVTYRDRLCSA